MTQRGERSVPDPGVRPGIARIPASPHSTASERDGKFLSIVVEEALASRADRIAAHMRGTSVFGRDERFDPQLDSILRIDAGRSRRAIERFRLAGGEEGPLRIDVPCGGHMPSFSPTSARFGRAAAQIDAPSVLVTAFDEAGVRSRVPTLTRRFARAPLIARARVSGSRVFATDAALQKPDAPDAPTRSATPAAYHVGCRIWLGSDRFEVDVLLIEADTGRAVWTECHERAEIAAFRDEVAERVDPAIARPTGAIRVDLARDVEGAPPERIGSSAATTFLRLHRRTFERDMIEPLRAALERAVAAEPGCGEARACLSLVHSNAYRFRHRIAASDPDPLGRSVRLARRAVERPPNARLAHHAIWFVAAVEGSHEALKAGRALHPNVGGRYAMLAPREDATARSKGATAADPALLGGDRADLFLTCFAAGPIADARDEAQRIDAPGVVYGHVAVAAAAVERGRRAKSTGAVARRRSLAPDHATRAAAGLRSRRPAPERIDAVVASRPKAARSVEASRP